ncbi:MAG TPA: hemerythrin domain-containing protein [Usitatibacter sp.]|nr:hemerythrin domain-containing protein [Usitatibacter sp.]
MSDDIRDQLRKDHESVLAELDALRSDCDGKRCLEMLQRLRRSWMTHALAEETVVYRALEGVEAANDSRNTRADERFVEHELVEGLFDKLSRSRPGTLEWHARVNVAAQLIRRHIETEHEDTFVALGERFDQEQLDEIGRRFTLARDKLHMLEEAKAA